MGYDKKLMKEYQGQPCVICESEETTADHVKCIGMGGNNPNANKRWNLMPLCGPHHQEKERIKPREMAEKYKKYLHWLLENGWEQCYLTKRWIHK